MRGGLFAIKIVNHPLQVIIACCLQWTVDFRGGLKDFVGAFVVLSANHAVIRCKRACVAKFEALDLSEN